MNLGVALEEEIKKTIREVIKNELKIKVYTCSDIVIVSLVLNNETITLDQDVVMVEK